MALSLVLADPALALGAQGSGPPAVAKPRPAPDRPSTMPPLPPAVIDDELAIGGTEVDAKQVKTRLTVEVLVNGRGPYQFLVDSGADTSVVGLRIARDLELPLGSPVILNGMTSRNIVDRVVVNELTLGQSTIRGLELPALKEQDMGGAGMIGIDALVQQRLMMDFEKKIIRVEDAREPAKVLDGEIVVTARRQRGQLILTEVSIGKVQIEAVIDTGTEISIGNTALRDKLFRGRRDRPLTVAATGVTGVTVNLELAIVKELRLGSVILRNVPIAFADLPPFEVFGLKDEPSLLIGTDLLETFRRVSLDFRSRKVRFQLRRCGSSIVEFATMESSTISRLSSGGNDSVCRREARD
ncbi:retroviral-like aspartic protease family protein [Sphingomonas xanthus]|uniref:Peptidase A2 domain-containing protein n=1 Tax=Sphingomonas xanthus TaxID=2594473 RepID=A0A516ISG5_9SPHN|nr:retroviral-like aspartic protease family protein [Sphingomonas xanthus]QDP19851.1 hypothetical protein FMM02_07705 [Sphingomonas xanthus]